MRELLADRHAAEAGDTDGKARKLGKCCMLLEHTKVVGRVGIATGPHPWLYGHAKNDVGSFEDRVHGLAHSQL
jgi:hypothetical protein